MSLAVHVAELARIRAGRIRNAGIQANVVERDGRVCVEVNAPWPGGRCLVRTQAEADRVISDALAQGEGRA